MFIFHSCQHVTVCDTAEPNIATTRVIVKQNVLPIGDIVPRKTGIRNVSKWRTVEKKTLIRLGSNTFRVEENLFQKRDENHKGLDCKFQISM